MQEKEMAIDNFDSGPGVEDILREAIGDILPVRYSVRSGVINDSLGRTAGDFDVLVFNSNWFPIIKGGATKTSRRYHYPVEGVYAVIEVKQSLGFEELDAAMEKLVVCHRLHRPSTLAYRMTENREGSDCNHGLTNPLYSAIVASDLKDGVNFEDLIERFYHINKTLKRLEVVRALCVLGHGTITWGVRSQLSEIRPALFMLDDLYQPIVPAYHSPRHSKSSLYSFMSDLLLHLYHSILAPEDVAPSYGVSNQSISAPSSEEIRLDPDEEWLERLKVICKKEHM
ncbi:DUF6602 domain-containing protein [Deinococcus aetherius]|uniref:DUF6602 domain-containing protein n=1 Tax=Deinococcus aetherius TaxID=200252 RepID=UPI00222F8375|nr:DUF6602 domain-containing protein [Deinococcus aetherius]